MGGCLELMTVAFFHPSKQSYISFWLLTYLPTGICMKLFHHQLCTATSSRLTFFWMMSLTHMSPIVVWQLLLHLVLNDRYLHNCWLLWVQPSGIHHVWNIRCEGWCLQLWSCHVRAHYWAQASGQGTRAFCLKRGSSFLRICCICTRFIWCLLLKTKEGAKPGALGNTPAAWHWCARKNGRSSIRGCIPGKVSLPACRRCCLVCTARTRIRTSCFWSGAVTGTTHAACCVELTPTSVPQTDMDVPSDYL